MERILEPLNKGASQGDVLCGSGHTIERVSGGLFIDLLLGFCGGKFVLGVWQVGKARNISLEELL